MSEKTKPDKERPFNWAFLGSFIGAAVLLIAAWAFQPSTPTVLEISKDQTEQQCTQSRETNSSGTQGATGPIQEVYKWSCEPESDAQYKKNDANDQARSSTDADLLAQERVAYWTKIIAALTALGVGILGWTLYETRNVAAITRDIGRQQVRAYIGFDNISTILPVDRDPRGDALLNVNDMPIDERPDSPIPLVGDKVRGSFSYVNFGNSPAFVKREGLTVTIAPKGFAVEDIPNPVLLEESYVVPPGKDFVMFGVDKNPLTIDQRENLQIGKNVIVFKARVEYIDIFGASRYSNFCYFRNYRDDIGMDTMRAHRDGNDAD